jgi:hypothetical protein
VIIGNTTEKFTIFAACDSKYLLDHAKGFITSCALAKNNVHLHVTGPSQNDHKYLSFLSKGYKILSPETDMTTSYDDFDVSAYSPAQRKTFYACNRYMVAPDVVKCDVLILDIDCFIMSNIEPFKADVGIFFRGGTDGKDKWEREGNLLAAGALYVAKNHLDFIIYTKNIIQEYIDKQEIRWFLDQVALIRAYKNFPNKNYATITNEFLDWDFKEKTKVWTGKGSRKSLNPVYGHQHKEFKKKFPLGLAEI